MTKVLVGLHGGVKVPKSLHLEYQCGCAPAKRGGNVVETALVTSWKPSLTGLIVILVRRSTRKASTEDDVHSDNNQGSVSTINSKDVRRSTRRASTEDNVQLDNNQGSVSTITSKDVPQGWIIKDVVISKKGIQFLHQRKDPIIHKDLKSANLLVDKNWEVKVLDFGVSKTTDHIATCSRNSITGFNPRWLAPELFAAGGRSDTATDVYSFGIVMWELLTMQEPYKGLLNAQIIFGVSERGIRPDIPPMEKLPGNPSPSSSSAYIALMQRCWSQDAELRPTFKTIALELQTILVNKFNTGPSN